MSERVTYPTTLTMREARRLYFEANEFGSNGGYDDAWVDVKIGPIPFPFPNSQGRVKAVRYHDLHHILTEYQTDFVGEAEIAAWEIGAGCKRYVAAWLLNLTALGGGLFAAPRRTFVAFVRGRGSETLYGGDLESILDETVGTMRARCTPAEREPRTSETDTALFVAAAAGGLVVGALFLVAFTPLVPFGLVAKRFALSSAPE